MIVDDTLREGLQSPGMSYKIEEKLKIAELLSSAGVKTALVSYPSAHESEFLATQQIVKRSFFHQTFGLGRTIRSDIDCIYETGANISLHLPFQFDGTSQIIEAVKYASSKGRSVEVAVVDILKYGEDMLLKLCTGIINAGAEILQLPDTTGSATPRKIRNIVSKVRSSVPNATTEVHCHNDMGLSTQNAIAGLEAGADRVDCTVYGLGERNGITDEMTILEYLEHENIETGIDRDRLRSLYEYVLALILEKTGSSLFLDNFPITGKNVGIHTAGTHASFPGVFKGEDYSVNVYTGKSMIKKILNLSGLSVKDNQIIQVVKRVKDQAVETGMTLNVEGVARIAGEIIDESA